MTFAERMTEAGIGTLIGVCTVFVVLILLWAFIEIMHFAVEKSTAPKKPKKQTETPAEQTVSEPSADNNELIAVITAAVACMLEAQGVPATNFKIKSFRRTN